RESKRRTGGALAGPAPQCSGHDLCGHRGVGRHPDAGPRPHVAAAQMPRHSRGPADLRHHPHGHDRHGRLAAPCPPHRLAAIAPPEGARVPRRALAMAWRGMSVPQQAGAMLSLEKAGVRLPVVDGATRGTMKLGMLLSGLSTEDMCERARTLDTKDFMALLP